MKVFDSREELKWYYHKKLCHGDTSTLYFMEQCVNEKDFETVKDLNKWLKKMRQPCRVKES